MFIYDLCTLWEKKRITWAAFCLPISLQLSWRELWLQPSLSHHWSSSCGSYYILMSVKHFIHFVVCKGFWVLAAARVARSHTHTPWLQKVVMLSITSNFVQQPAYNNSPELPREFLEGNLLGSGINDMAKSKTFLSAWRFSIPFPFHLCPWLAFVSCNTLMMMCNGWFCFPLSVVGRELLPKIAALNPFGQAPMYFVCRQQHVCTCTCVHEWIVCMHTQMHVCTHTHALKQKKLLTM